MLRTIRMAIVVLASAAAAAAWTSGAQAFSGAALESHNRARLAGEGRLLELHILDVQQRSLAFQERQQLHREQDRDATRYRPPQLEIPQMRRNCQMQPNGAHFLPNCR